MFARPKLKLFLLGAVLILVAKALISTGESASNQTAGTRWAARTGSPADLGGLLVEAREHPSCELFIRISEIYEKRGDLRQALRYLRKADVAESAEDL